MDLIKKNINVLESIGLNVRSVTADQGSSNRSAFKTLGSTIEHPYFIHNDKFVYLLYDACHLVKSFRNAVYNRDLETLIGTVSWQVIRELHNPDRNSVVKLCPKLTDIHVELNTFDKMNIKLAVQVLSHSCSSAIKAAVTSKKICNKNALPTAEYLDFMNKLFDCLNSKSKFDRSSFKAGL